MDLSDLILRHDMPNTKAKVITSIYDGKISPAVAKDTFIPEERKSRSTMHLNSLSEQKGRRRDSLKLSCSPSENLAPACTHHQRQL
jgi:hypothetical protein